MNTSFTQHWENITDKFEKLNQRERWLIAGAILVIIYASLNTLLLEPALMHKKALATAISTDQAQINTLNQQMSLLAQESVIDPDAQNKQRITALQDNLQLLDDQLKNLQTTLIEPERMPDLLRSLLQKNSQVKLIALKTLPSSSLQTNAPANIPGSSEKTSPAQDHAQMATEAEIFPAFKHGVEITLEGNYLDLLAYVSALEKTPWHVLWSNASLNSGLTALPQWPENRLKLTLYTLSLDQTWLSI